MKDIEVLLIQAWKLAVKQGNMKLAEAIVSIPGVFDSEPDDGKRQEFETFPDRPPADFRIPSGKFRNRKISGLSSAELQNLWAGFNGCGNLKVAVILREELNRRKRS